jgi:hypothetical protein
MLQTYILNRITDPPMIEEVPLSEWAAWLESDQRIVAEAILGCGAKVSTVFYGINCGQFRQFFHTLIRGGPLDGQEQWSVRYQEALAAQQFMVIKAEQAGDAEVDGPHIRAVKEMLREDFGEAAVQEVDRALGHLKGNDIVGSPSNEF